jgi:osmotically-inducible protein OsmY
MEETNQPTNTPDEVIRQDIIDKLTHDPGIDTSKIQVEVENGKVILKGKADTEVEKQLSAKIARSVAGVKEVENHLHVDLGIIHALTSLAAHIQGDIIKDDDDKETQK